MKAHRDEAPRPFIPVTLTLESQAEVDAVFVLLNHTRLSDVLKLGEAYKALVPFRDPISTSYLHQLLCRHI
jgi:hypothetical protein